MSRVLEAELTWTGAAFERRHCRSRSAPTAGSRRSAAWDRPAPTGCASIALLPGFVERPLARLSARPPRLGRELPAGRRQLLDLARGDVPAGRVARPGHAPPDLAPGPSPRCATPGITTVGEFHYVHHEREGDFALDDAMLEAAADAGIRMVLLYCFYATGAPGRPLEGGQRRFATPVGGRVLAPGGPPRRAASMPPRRRSASRRTAFARPSPDADPADSRRRRPPRAAGPPARGGAAARDRGVVRRLRPHADGGRSSRRCRAGAFTAVHCTHTADEDMARFLGAGGIVCLCPLTEGNLGDGIPRLDRAHAAGGRLAIGTDSNNRLAMLEEMRWLEYGQRLRGEMRGALPGRGRRRGADAAGRRDDRRRARAVAAGRPDRGRLLGRFRRRSISRAPALAEVPPDAPAGRAGVRGGERGDRGDVRRRAVARERRSSEPA